MNSKQRRKFKRKWRYQAAIKLQPDDVPFYTLDQICKWCNRRFGKNGYETYWDLDMIFVFDSTEKLVEFQMVWQ